MKTLATILLVVSLFVLPLHAQGTKTVHVDQLVADNTNNQGASNLITAKLISYLSKRGVSVVEGDADTVLTGTCQIVSVTKNGYTHYHIQGAMRLTDKDGKILWGDVIKNSPTASSASSSFADSVAKAVAEFLSQK